MDEPLRLLMIEDSPSDAMLLEEQLRDSALTVAVDRVGTLGEGLHRLAGGGVDVVLLDLGLPDSSGLDTFEQVAAAAPRVPVVVATGLDDSRLGEEAVQRGAQDYMLKDDTTPARLGRAVTYAVRRRHNMDTAEHAMRDQLEAKDRFLSHISHELRSPLAVIHQFVSLVADGIGGPVTDEQCEYLDVAGRNIHQLKKMIDDLLDATRLGRDRLSIEPQETDAAVVVEETCRFLEVEATERGLVLERRLGHLPTTWCDADRLRQVLVNILQNSIKFTESGGTIAVSAEGTGGFVTVKVEDSGRGIRAENLERVFDQFFQETRDDGDGRSGLGLGLFVCKELVTRQGGAIWAESGPGLGTTVTFTIPITASREM